MEAIMAAAAQIFRQSDEPAIRVEPASRPRLALLAALAPERRLRCRWEYSAEQRRLVQTWEVAAG
jgi:hypothetical protein